jgi:hypothetical protein
MVFASHPLWLSLRSFPLDDPSHAVPFSVRLRREQGWTREFASRVLAEYRRFLFLTATSEDLAVPSEAVDQAWHLHMLDTRSYWEELCGRVAGRPIHHTPSRGGRAEDARHLGAYEATLRRYRETFAEAPPADVWPSPDERFAGRYRRVDTREAWIVRKSFARDGGVAAAATAVLAGCASAASSAVTGVVMASLLAVIVGVLIWEVREARVEGKDSRSTGGGGGCGGGTGGGTHCGDGGSGCGGGGCGGG